MSTPVAPGQVIKGKYRVERILGAGGMGVVVEARHVALEQRFAIEFLSPAMLANRDIVERFAREARALSRLEGDHVARVTDVDALEDGTPFMVMEFLEGHDLSVVRKQRRPLPVPWSVGGTGPALVGVGTVVGGVALGTYSDAKSACPTNDTCPSSSVDKKNSANTQANISNVAIGVGAAAVVTGVAPHFVMRKGAAPAATGMTFTPRLGRSLEVTF